MSAWISCFCSSTKISPENLPWEDRVGILRVVFGTLCWDAIAK